MASWAVLETEAPRIAERGRLLVMRTGEGEGMLTSIAGEGLPRTHPVVVAILEGRLLVFSIDGSPKTRELVTDGRYAFHTHLDPATPHELALRGRARVVIESGGPGAGGSDLALRRERWLHAPGAGHRARAAGRARDPRRVAAALHHLARGGDGAGSAGRVPGDAPDTCDGCVPGACNRCVLIRVRWA